MKIAIPVIDENNLKLNERFGRSMAFYIYDVDNQDFTIIDNNDNIKSAHGSGVQTSSLLAQRGINSVIVKEVGPKAHDVLKRSNIQVYIAKDTHDIKKLIEMYQNNLLTKLS